MSVRARDGLLLALGTLTAFPVPPPRDVDRSAARTAMALAAVPGLVLGLCWLAVSSLGGLLHLPALVVGVLGTGAIVLATRAFHVDGLADTVDGLAAAFSRERSLEVMRTGDVGPAGAAAVVLALGLDAACLASLHAGGRSGLGVLAVVASRAALALACRPGMPAARPDGLGALVAGVVPLPLVAAIGAVLAALAWSVTGGHGLAVVAAAAAAAELVVRHARRRVGGVTGDVLGAAVEVAFAAALVAAAATAG